MRMNLSILALAALTLISGGVAASENDPYVLKHTDDSRDPFSFSAKVPEHRIVVDSPALPASDIAEARRKLKAILPQSESALLEGDAVRALRDSDMGLAAVRDLRPEERAQFSEQLYALLRISKAAQRAIQRADAQKELWSLNIAVTGVLVRERVPQAIVNAKLVSPGDFVPLNNADDVPLVKEIRQNEIVVRFRGYLMSVDLK